MKLRILAALFFIASAASASEDTILFRQSSAGDLDVVEYMRKFSDFLSELFPGGSRTAKKLVLVLGRADNDRAAPDEVFVELDPAALRRGDLDELAKAGKAVLLHRQLCRRATGFPKWIAAAFRHRSRAADQAEKFLANNRIFPGIEAMMRYDALPEWKKILSTLPAVDSPAENLWFDEYSRVVATLLYRSGFGGTLEEVDDALNRIFKDKTGREMFRRCIWNKWNPMPVSEYEKKLSGLLQIRAAVVENGKVSEEFETFPASELGARTASHPERQQIWKDFSEKLSRSAAGFPLPLRSYLRRAAASAGAAGADPRGLPEFERALNEMERQLEKMKEQENFLDQCAGTSDGFIKIQQAALEENSRPGTLLSPESSKALQEIENYYIR